MAAIDIGAGTGLLGLDLLADVGSVVLADPSSGFDQAGLVARAQAAGFTDVASRNVAEITKDDGRRYPMFLLTGRRA